MIYCTIVNIETGHPRSEYNSTFEFTLRKNCLTSVETASTKKLLLSFLVGVWTWVGGQ
ncbi:hypothetical protein ACHAXS_000149 [Conticribra weissflogii]